MIQENAVLLISYLGGKMPAPQEFHDSGKCCIVNFIFRGQDARTTRVS